MYSFEYNNNKICLMYETIYHFTLITIKHEFYFIYIISLKCVEPSRV